MRKILAAVPRVLFLGLLLSPSASGAQDPPFVARHAAVDPLWAGCHQLPLVGMWPDGRFLLSWAEMGNGVRTVGFTAQGALDVNPNTFGHNADWKDLSVVPGGGFVLTVHRGHPVNNLEAWAYVPPQYDGLEFEGPAGSKPVVDAGPSGDSVVAWALDTPTSIVARRFDAAGQPQGGIIPVAGLAGAAQEIDVIRRADGGFVVFWEESQQLRYRRFASTGAPLGDSVLVASQGPSYPRAARAADDTIALVYTDAASASLVFRLLAADGQLSQAFNVWNDPANPVKQGTPAFLADGDLAVVADVLLGGNLSTIRLLRFGRDGQRRGSSVVVGTAPVPIPDRVFSHPQVATAGDRTVVFYQVDWPQPRMCRLVQQIFDATLFADGFESGDLLAWDGGA